MQRLGLNQMQVAKVQLPGSRFPERADVYVCDNCGRDITSHLHPGRAHVRTPLGPSRYVCTCGQKYLTGTVEWDELSEWDKRAGIRDAIALGVISALFLGFSVLVRFAVGHRSLVALIFSAIAVLPVIALFMMWLDFMLGAIEIAASLWRTRLGRSFPVRRN